MMDNASVLTLPSIGKFNSVANDAGRRAVSGQSKSHAKAAKAQAAEPH